MLAEVLSEPELEFGGGGRHIDPRFGISNYGPADLADQPGRPVRVGLIGPAKDVDGLRDWLERCRGPIPATKDERYPHLFTGFPGCDVDRGLFTRLVLSDLTTNTVSSRALADIGAAVGPAAVTLAVEQYAQEARARAQAPPGAGRPSQTSDFNDDEARGFEAAARQRDVEEVELTWITHSEGIRAYRRGAAPPLRGTHLELGDGTSVLYIRGRRLLLDVSRDVCAAADRAAAPGARREA